VDLVDYAIQQGVDVVALTGDVVDEENKLYEAFGPLQNGVRQLEEANIDVVAVAGNHDYDALPRLSGMVESERFTLLGQGGQWDSITLTPNQSTPVQIIGWSFRQRHISTSPIDSLPADLFDADMPTIGLLHADLDVKDSVYAPVTLNQLREQPVAAWLLGHIHAHQVWDDRSPLVLYPGSPQPLRPTETGAHGPWIVEVEEDGTARASHIPRSTLRYSAFDVDLSNIDQADNLEGAITDAIRGKLQEAKDTGPEIQHLVCRLRLHGRTSLHRVIQNRSTEWAQNFEVPQTGVVATVDQVNVETRPELNLTQIAKGNDPPGVLAQLLLALEGEDDDHEIGDELIQDAWAKIQSAVGQVTQSPAYQPLRESGTIEPQSEDLLVAARRQGILLLDELHAQTRSKSDA
jgi:DNA repair exonuclease SbcCD nuclease subunit